MRRVAIVLTLAALSACSQAPRAASYFKAHPDEAEQVLAECTAGTHRGAECDNAKTGQAQAASDKRLDLYKKSF